MVVRHKRGRLMHWQFTLDVFPVTASAVVSAVVALAIWRRRPAPGSIPFYLLMLAVAGWSLAYPLGLGSAGLPAALFLDNMTWLGACAWPTLGAALVPPYTGRA